MKLTTTITATILLLLLLIGTCFAITSYIEIEYSFTPPENHTTQSYTVYKDGVAVCTTSDVSGMPLVCDFETLPGTYNFTLAAKYTDGTESYKSPDYSFTIASVNGLTTPILLQVNIVKITGVSIVK